MNYVKPFFAFEGSKKPKHFYTIEFHRCKYTAELSELSLKYEKAVHKKNRDETFV